MVAIWLNHWFSTAYNIINLIKKDNPEFRIIGSNEREQSPMRAVCDEWYQEPILKESDYIDFCLNFCVEHKIDVFMPRRHMVAISKAKPYFEAAGVKVMVDDYGWVSLLNRKDKAYEFFAYEGIGVVPPHFVVTNVNDFLSSYEMLKRSFKQVCFKFVCDEGGKSYRLIDNTRKGYAALLKKQNTRMTLGDAVSALSERDEFAPLMVMPYLPGDEASVDCLVTKSGTIAIPRVKGPTRVESVIHDDEFLRPCFDLFKKVPLEQPCNIQFKYLDGTPYILEVNTRMSGGTHMSCLASGVNIPSIAVNKLLGIEKRWSDNGEDCFVSQVEVPVLL